MTNSTLMSQLLNTSAFDPAEAKRILDKLEFHYTPKHGSWLDMAEPIVECFSDVFVSIDVSRTK